MLSLFSVYESGDENGGRLRDLIVPFGMQGLTVTGPWRGYSCPQPSRLSYKFTDSCLPGQLDINL
jgi:hypothetical protein